MSYVRNQFIVESSVQQRYRRENVNHIRNLNHLRHMRWELDAKLGRSSRWACELIVLLFVYGEQRSGLCHFGELHFERTVNVIAVVRLIAVVPREGQRVWFQ